MINANLLGKASRLIKRIFHYKEKLTRSQNIDDKQPAATIIMFLSAINLYPGQSSLKNSKEFCTLKIFKKIESLYLPNNKTQKWVNCKYTEEHKCIHNWHYPLSWVEILKFSRVNEISFSNPDRGHEALLQ